jgi:hypothetical protein
MAARNRSVVYPSHPSICGWKTVTWPASTVWTRGQPGSAANPFDPSANRTAATMNMVRMTTSDGAGADGDPRSEAGPAGAGPARGS